MAKSTVAVVRQRVSEVIQLLVLGAEFLEIKQYTATHGWKVSDRQVRRYMEMANKQLGEAALRDRDELLGRHMMQRRALYARCIKDKDYRTAQAVLADEAKLLGLYAPTKIAPVMPDGEEPYRLTVAHLDADTLRMLKDLQDRMALLPGGTVNGIEMKGTNGDLDGHEHLELPAPEDDKDGAPDTPHD